MDDDEYIDIVIDGKAVRCKIVERSDRKMVVEDPGGATHDITLIAGHREIAMDTFSHRERGT